MQVNWFESHEKVIFCPKMKAVTLLNQDGSTQTFLVRKLHTLGITSGMMEKIKYAKQMVRKCKEGVVAEERLHKQRMRLDIKTQNYDQTKSLGKISDPESRSDNLFHLSDKSIATATYTLYEQ